MLLLKFCLVYMFIEYMFIHVYTCLYMFIVYVEQPSEIDVISSQ